MIKWPESYLVLWDSRTIYCTKEPEIKNYGTITLNRFYEMVNLEPYWDFIFLSVKYFDFSLKTWKDYDVNETELNDYFLSHFKSSSI